MQATDAQFLRIPVERFTGQPSPFVFELGADWWRRTMPRDLQLPQTLDAPLHIGFEGYRMAEEELYLEGTVTGSLELECSRCLARYRQPLREPFRLVLESAGARVPSEPEEAEALARDGICLGEDIEAGWYRGPEIDLAAFFLEVIALGLPVKPLCREECAGLCARCGADRNTDSCECEETRSESPFAVLQALRGGASEETEGNS